MQCRAHPVPVPVPSPSRSQPDQVNPRRVPGQPSPRTKGPDPWTTSRPMAVVRRFTQPTTVGSPTRPSRMTPSPSHWCTHPLVHGDVGRGVSPVGLRDHRSWVCTAGTVDSPKGTLGEERPTWETLTPHFHNPARRGRRSDHPGTGRHVTPGSTTLETPGARTSLRAPPSVLPTSRFPPLLSLRPAPHPAPHPTPSLKTPPLRKVFEVGRTPVSSWSHLVVWGPLS